MEWIIFMLICSVIFYFAPLVVAFVGVRYRYKTEWKHSTPDVNDIVLVFFPILNWIGSIWFLMEMMFLAMDKSFDNINDSELNKEIKDKEFAKKLFRL